MKFKSLFLISIGTIVMLTLTMAVIVPAWKHARSSKLSALIGLLPEPSIAAQVNSWTAAAEKIKEDRGEPVGRQATVETPSELRHYSDIHRFLATQVAEVNEHRVATPQDFVELARMVEQGQLVQVPLVTDNYVLFGVGGSADTSGFTRYENGESIELFNEAGLHQEYDRLAAVATDLERQSASLKQHLSTLKKRDRKQRAQLQTQIAAIERQQESNREHKKLLDKYYGAETTRTALLADFDALNRIGTKLAGNSFQMTDGNSRRQLKLQLLASMRPEALKVLEEIADSYHAQFNRPLPVTSLVRPDEYQLELSKTNANATRIETPPHSTGLAFDILYRYMSAAEQAFVMSELAKLKDDRRIEVLRENRDHYHVFAFVDGERPAESYIASALRNWKSAKPATQNEPVAMHHAAKNNRKASAPQKKTVRGKANAARRKGAAKRR